MVGSILDFTVVAKASCLYIVLYYYLKMDYTHCSIIKARHIELIPDVSNTFGYKNKMAML